MRMGMDAGMGSESKAGGGDGAGEVLRTVNEGDCVWMLGLGSEGCAGVKLVRGGDGRGRTQGEAAWTLAGEVSGERGRDGAIRIRVNETGNDSGEDEREDAALGGERGCREGGDFSWWRLKGLGVVMQRRDGELRCGRALVRRAYRLWQPGTRGGEN